MRITIKDGRGERVLDSAGGPLLIGGEDSVLFIPGPAGVGGPAAIFVVDGDGIYVQPADEEDTIAEVNGITLTQSQWLENGDVISLSGVEVDVAIDEGECRMSVREAPEEPDTEPPLEQSSATVDVPPAHDADRVAPVVYKPKLRSSRGERKRGRLGFWVATALVLLGLGLATVIVLSAQVVTIETTPAAKTVSLDGRWPVIQLSNGFMVVPGAYTLEAGRAGFETLKLEIEVGGGHENTVRAVLEPLPGRLTVRTARLIGADVLVDGVHVGTTPVTDHALVIGEHRVEVLANRHQPFVTTVEVTEPAQELAVDAELVEAWGPLSVTSQPTGASITLDGQPVGRTPTTVEAGAGSRLVTLKLEGYEPFEQRVTVVAGKRTGVTVTLHRAPAVVELRTVPSGATITVDGTFGGVSPAKLEVKPDREHRIRASLAGYAPGTETIRLRAGERRSVVLDLAPRTGRIRLIDLPPGAVVSVDGNRTDPVDNELELLAVPHVIEVAATEGEPFRVEVLPQPGATQEVRVPQTVSVTEEPPAEEVKTARTTDMRLVRPGRFTMGAPRRQPGRKANEILREVEITRAYYLGMREVTNREYREFNSAHLSGKVGSSNLEIDHHPVVRVTWEDAARYCNWLSGQEGLDPVYVLQGGAMAARSPIPNGYRLPTEAEWAWAARHPGGGDDRKYGWGDALPIPRGAGNFGDASAHAMLGESITDYDDGIVGTAAAGSFEPNSVGIFNLAGNVAEWVHDVYEVRVPSAGVEKDPTGPATGEYHVIRGASYMSDRVTELRLSKRDSGKERRPDLGFRIARYAE